MKTYFIKVIPGFILSFLIVCPVWAGSQQADEMNFPIETLVTLSKKIDKTMAEKGARVFIIARQGRSLEQLPDGVEYTHVSFGVYSSIEAEGRDKPMYGYAYYNLYQDNKNSSKSKLVVDYSTDYLASIYETRVGIIIPTPKLQKRLLNLISSSSYQGLHNPEYSVLANPYNTKYQNCTEFVLDVINAAIYETDNTETLKSNTETYFKAYDVNISPLTLFFGSIFVEAIRVDDHEGQIRTATFTSIADYLRKYDLMQEEFIIKL